MPERLRGLHEAARERPAGLVRCDREYQKAPYGKSGRRPLRMWRVHTESRQSQYPITERQGGILR